jgi:hypothetical protein
MVETDSSHRARDRAEQFQCRPCVDQLCVGGWFAEGELYAVAMYVNGINQIQNDYLARVTGLSVKRSDLFELPSVSDCVSFSDPANNGFKKRHRGVAYASGGI